MENGSVWTVIDHGSVGSKLQAKASYSSIARGLDCIGFVLCFQLCRVVSAKVILVQQSRTLPRGMSRKTVEAHADTLNDGRESLLFFLTSMIMAFVWTKSKSEATNGSMWSHRCFQWWCACYSESLKRYGIHAIPFRKTVQITASGLQGEKLLADSWMWLREVGNLNA